MRLKEYWDNGLLTINPNDFLLNFSQYETQFDLNNKLLYLDIPDNFQIQDGGESKIPLYHNFKFTCLKYICPWDSLVVHLNLNIPKDELILLFIRNDVKFAFINTDTKSSFPLENMKLVIYTNEEIKYIFEVDQYTLDKDFEIYGLNVTPSANLVGLLNNVKQNHK